MARKRANEKRGERAEFLKALQDPESVVALNGKRVQPWSEESAELAMQELGGKHGDNGMVIWPKGTVEKLLMERTKYADIVAKYKKAEARAQPVRRAGEMARRTVSKIMKKAAKTDNDPTWRVHDELPEPPPPGAAEGDVGEKLGHSRAMRWFAHSLRARGRNVGG